MPSGVWLERNLDWLAMGSGWKTESVERERGGWTSVGGTGSMWPVDGVGLAGMAQLDSHNFFTCVKA